MQILAIDPGATTGWCVYDAAARCVVDAGEFEHDSVTATVLDYMRACDVTVLERPKGQGPTRPQVVECGIVFGSLWRDAQNNAKQSVWLHRLEICKRLTAALHDTIRVRNDATAWAALVALHGEGSDQRPRMHKKQIVQAGGCISRAKSHARAALAAAFAYTLPACTR